MAVNGAFHLPPGATPWCATIRAVEGRIKYLNNTGTNVNDSTRLATRDTHTEIESGGKRYLPAPCSPNTRNNTMHVPERGHPHSTPTSAAPSAHPLSHAPAKRPLP